MIPFFKKNTRALAVGFPSGKEGLGSKVFRAVRKRKALDEIVSLEEYGKA